MFQLIENQTFQEMKYWHSMFHFWFQCFIFYLPHPFPKKHNGSDLKTQWERFKTSMGEKSNPNGRNTTETLKSKMKHRMSMFHLLKVLIINALCYKNETWNKKRLKVNIMYARVRACKERVLTSKQRVLTWGRRVPASAFACQGSMPWQANTRLSPGYVPKLVSTWCNLITIKLKT